MSGKLNIGITNTDKVSSDSMEIFCGRNLSKREFMTVLNKLSESLLECDDAAFNSWQGKKKITLHDVFAEFKQPDPMPEPVEEPVKSSRIKIKGMRASKNRDISKDSQGEFKFVEMSEQRGFFDGTQSYVRNGADMDIPTYMRLGIKISL